MKKAYRVLFLEGPYLWSNQSQDDCHVTGVSALAEKYSKSLGDTHFWCVHCSFDHDQQDVILKVETPSDTLVLSSVLLCVVVKIFKMFWNTGKLSWKPRYLFQSEPSIKIAC